MSEDYEEILISTPIDQMIQIIKEQGEVPLEYLALKLKYDPETIEDWARILERDGILELKYGLDKTVVRWNAPTKEEFEERTAKIEEKKEKIENDIERLQQKIAQEEAEIANLITSMAGEIEEIKEERARIKEFFKLIDEMRVDVHKTAAQLEKEVLSLKDGLAQITTQINGVEMIVKAVDPKELQQLVDDITKNIQLKQEEWKELTDELSQEIERLRKLSLPSLEELQKIKAELKEFKRKLPKLEAILTSIESVSEVLKSKEEFLREYQEIQQELAKIMEELNMLSGPVDVLEKRIKEIAQRLAELQKRGAELNQQLTINMEIINNLQEVVDKESLEDLITLAHKIEEWMAFVERFPETLEDVGDLIQNLDTKLRQYNEEHGKITASIKSELQALNKFIEIEEGFQRDVEEMKKTIEEIKKKAAEGYVKIEEKLEEIDKLREALDEVLTSDSFMAGLKALESLEQRMDEVTKKYEMLRELYAELDEIKKQFNILMQNIRIAELRRPPEEVKKLEEKVDNVSKKRARLNEWLEGLFKNKDQ